MTTADANRLRAKWQATMARHRVYGPPLYRNRDGIWACPCCNPAPWWRKALARTRQWWQG